MALPNWISTREICGVFADEIGEMGGQITNAYDDGERLFGRSILPGEREVRRGDALRGGVALMMGDREIRVHPYVFRRVCGNGAIMAQSVQTRRIELASDEDAHDQVVGEVRETIRACGEPDVFADGVAEIRSSVDREADFALTVLPMLDRLPEAVRVSMMGLIAGRFFGAAERSRYGLMNAITSLARDTSEPDLKWRLEEIGGRIPAMQPVPRRPVGMAMVPPQTYVHA
jgi:hypothetical protein